MPDMINVNGKTTFVPEIESGLRIPMSAAEAFPDISVHEELQMRARTIKMISDMSGEPIKPDVEQQQDAEILARAMVENPGFKPEFSRYPNETIAWLAGMIQAANVALVPDLAELKQYIITKLVYEIETGKFPKDRLQALTKLGEVAGVDAFMSRSEMTVRVKPIEEIEKELKTIINNVEYKVIEGPKFVPSPEKTEEE